MKGYLSVLIHQETIHSLVSLIALGTGRSKISLRISDLNTMTFPSMPGLMKRLLQSLFGLCKLSELKHLSVLIHQHMSGKRDCFLIKKRLKLFNYWISIAFWFINQTSFSQHSDLSVILMYCLDCRIKMWHITISCLS